MTSEQKTLIPTLQIGRQPPAQPAVAGRLRLVAVTLCSFLLLSHSLFAQNEPEPVTQPPQTEPADQQPETKPLTPEAEKALVEDTNKTAIATNPAQEEDENWQPGRNRRGWGPPMIVIGRDAEVQAGESVETLVVIGGNGKVRGRVREAIPESVAVFIAPPSLDALRARLVGRGTDSPEQVDERLRTAEHELEAQPEFAHVVVNDRLEQATGELEGIVRQRLPAQ